MTDPQRLKIPLAEQIAEVTRQRDAFAAALKLEGVEVIGLHSVQGIVDRLTGASLTLSLLAAHETEFRAFMAQRSKGMGR